MELVRVVSETKGKEQGLTYSALMLLDCGRKEPAEALKAIPYRLAGIVFLDGRYERALPVGQPPKWLVTAKAGQVPAHYAFKRWGSALGERLEDQARFKALRGVKVEITPPSGASGNGGCAKLTPAEGHTLLEVFLLSGAGFDLVDPPAAAPAAVPPAASTGRIAKIEGDVLTLHVLRGHSGIMRPVQLSRATVVIRPDGKVGAIADLKPDQWVKVTFAEKWTDRRWINAVRIEPAAAPWPAAPPATQPAAADPAATDKTIADLIGRFGGSDFRAREAATRKLVEIGEPARAALEKAAAGGAAETTARAKGVLAKLDERKAAVEFARETRAGGEIVKDLQLVLSADKAECRPDETVKFTAALLNHREKPLRYICFPLLCGPFLVITGPDGKAIPYVEDELRSSPLPTILDTTELPVGGKWAHQISVFWPVFDPPSEIRDSKGKVIRRYEGHGWDIRQPGRYTVVARYGPVQYARMINAKLNANVWDGQITSNEVILTVKPPPASRPSPPPAPEPPASGKEIAGLVARLDSKDSKTREAATKKLIEIANEEAKKAYRKKHGMAPNAVVGDFDYPRKPTGSRYNTQVKAEGENWRVIFTISLTVAGRTTVNRTEVVLDKTGKLVGEVKFQTLQNTAPGWGGRAAGPASFRVVAPEQEVEQLIRQLGDSDWKVREQATQRLRRLIASHGRPVADRIAQELKSPDPEVRQRTEILLEKFGLKEGFRVPAPLGRWSGTVKDERLLRLAPAGYIGDPGAWAAVWKAWRGDEKLPGVDFATEIVVVSWVSGPKGDWDDVFYAVTADGGLVNTTTIAGRPPFKGFGYLLMRVKREGIRRVFGRAVNAKAGAAGGVEMHLVSPATFWETPQAGQEKKLDDLVLRVANRGDKDIWSMPAGDIKLIVRSAGGKALKDAGGQHGEVVPRPLLIQAGQTGEVRFAVTVRRGRDRGLPDVSILEPTRFVHAFHDLAPETYTIELIYENTLAKLGTTLLGIKDRTGLSRDTPLWTGKITTAPWSVRVWPERQAAEKADAPLLKKAHARTFPADRWERFEQLSGAGRWDGIEKIATRLAEADLIEAVQVACSLTDRIGRQCFANGIAKQWAGTDPKAAAAWIGDVEVWDPVRLAQIVFGKWAESGAAAAAAHVAAMKRGHLRDMSMGFVLQEWAQGDPKAAIAWAAALPDDLPVQEIGSMGMAGKTWPTGYRFCRDDAMQVILFYWRPAQADRAWIEKSPLPDRLKRRLTGRPAEAAHRVQPATDS